MHFAIVVSKADQAGMNIKQCLIELGFEETKDSFEDSVVYEFKGEKNKIKMYTVEKESIYNEDIDKKINADFFIFATKHQAASGIHSLSAHTAGNWGKADFGGQERKLCMAPASFLKNALIQLHELAVNHKYEIIQECTHHGPYLEKPSMFIEIGSDSNHWLNKDSGVIIGKAIIHLTTQEIEICEAAFGIGGLHHTPIFTKIMDRSKIAFGHVCPKYNLHNLDREMIVQALEKTSEKVQHIILEWKGMGKEKDRIVNLLNEMNLEFKQAEKFL